MIDDITQYPLQWPAGWRRTPKGAQCDAKFRKGTRDRVDLYEGIARVYHQLRAMGIPEHQVVISSELRPRLGGSIAAWTHLDDQGVAVYWQDGDQQRCMAIDQYTRLPDNLAAIAATIEAMRSIERHGGAIVMKRAFQGFTALPAPESWWQLLDLKGPNVTEGDIQRAYRKKISEHHPDNGGNTDLAARINRARDQGLEAIK